MLCPASPSGQTALLVEKIVADEESQNDKIGAEEGAFDLPETQLERGTGRRNAQSQDLDSVHHASFELILENARPVLDSGNAAEAERVSEDDNAVRFGVFFLVILRGAETSRVEDVATDLLPRPVSDDSPVQELGECLDLVVVGLKGGIMEKGAEAMMTRFEDSESDLQQSDDDHNIGHDESRDPEKSSDGRTFHQHGSENTIVGFEIPK